MCFDLQTVLNNSEKFQLEDSESFNKVVKNNQAEDFSEIKKIITRWKDDIFQEDLFATIEGFKELKFMKIIELKGDGGDQLSENMTIAVSNLHHITYQGLHDITHRGIKVERKLSENYLQQIQNVFSDLAKTFPDTLEISRNQIFQLSLHPNLLSKCSEEFLKRIADKLGNRTEFFNIKNVLKGLTSIPEVCIAIECLSNNLFIEKACHKKEYNLIQNMQSAPLLQNSSYENSFDVTSSYMMAIVMKAINEEKEVCEDDMAKMKMSLENLKQHSRNLKITHDIFGKKTSAKKNLDGKEVKLNEYQIESQKNIALLKEKLAQAKLEHKEALNGSLHYKTLSNALKEIIDLREKTCLDVEQKLESLQKKSDETIAKMTIAITESKNRYWDALSAVKKAPCHENIALNVDRETLDRLQVIADNIPHLVMCYKKYVSFAKEKQSNDVEEKGWLTSITSLVW